MTETLVTNIGKEAYFEDYPLLILFNEEVPDELRDSCILHRFLSTPTPEKFVCGAKIHFDQEEYIVTEIGNVAFENFRQFGHLSFYFGSGRGVLPGAIRLDRPDLPELKVDSLIVFIE